MKFKSGKSLNSILNNFNIEDLLNKGGVTFVDVESNRKIKFNAIKFGNNYLITTNDGEEESVPITKVLNFIKDKIEYFTGEDSYFQVW